jgi:hypothetical protein
MKLILVDIVIINGNILYVYRDSVEGDLYGIRQLSATESGTRQLYATEEKPNIILQRMSYGQVGDQKFVIEDRAGFNATVIDNDHNWVILEVNSGKEVKEGNLVNRVVLALPYLRAVDATTPPNSNSKYIDWNGDPVKESVDKTEVKPLVKTEDQELAKIQEKLQDLCGANSFNENQLLGILNGKGSGVGGGGRVSGGGGATMILHRCQVNKPYKEVKQAMQARLAYLQELKNNSPNDEKKNIDAAIEELNAAIAKLNKTGGGKYPKKSKSKSKKSKKSKSKKSKKSKSKKSKSKK